MTNKSHPITLSWEQIDNLKTNRRLGEAFERILVLAAQMGADQELEAIIELAGQSALPDEARYFDGMTVASLRDQRRPKPPSLKQQALDEVHISFDKGYLKEKSVNLIRRALEQIDG